MYRTANFEEIKNYIKFTVLQMKRAATMITLQYISGINDKSYRCKLKNRIKNEFEDKITFLSSGNNLPEVIVSSDYLTTTNVHHDDTVTLKQVVKICRRISSISLKIIRHQTGY